MSDLESDCGEGSGVTGATGVEVGDWGGGVVFAAVVVGVAAGVSGWTGAGSFGSGVAAVAAGASVRGVDQKELLALALCILVAATCWAKAEAWAPRWDLATERICCSMEACIAEYELTGAGAVAGDEVGGGVAGEGILGETWLLAEEGVPV